MLKVFIGYDPREAVAFHVCASSIIRHASVPVSIVPLALNNLKGYSETHTDGSNQFIYSRFLVPHLMDHKGWALFVDGDMLFRDDIATLFGLIEHDKAVMVVKHDYHTKRAEKYLGAKNQDYPRKNWSSVVLWNCGSAINNKLTPEYIQRASGAELHRFAHIPDERIGELPKEWNWLPDEFGENKNAKLLHWTLGTPCFHDEEYANAPMATEWHRERMLANYSVQKEAKVNL
jgi:lipopolysaccharide biosynthesis glycosyltransferase